MATDARIHSEGEGTTTSLSDRPSTLEASRALLAPQGLAAPEGVLP